ncbi:hypothetical protein PHLCEN_2v2039 [Hermanssonia centrifuga]|uniref:Uncharacterized protein n=1 Tax=Hermanssonia centrifuga TaxID=98765 RepID=A0A2R6RQ88_9APHY|nr:hypothetical protein PHLCEN_2v2039 [Hermanssonia centrifuga]
MGPSLKHLEIEIAPGPIREGATVTPKSPIKASTKAQNRYFVQVQSVQNVPL